MKIASIQYSIKHSALEIYLSGCKVYPKCKGCHNPELWDFNYGDEVDLKKIKRYVKDFEGMIDNIFIMGGDPLDNPQDVLLDFLESIQPLRKKIWVFTRFNLRDIQSGFLDRLRCKINYLKTGAYVEELMVEDNVQFDVKLATSNQVIIKF